MSGEGTCHSQLKPTLFPPRDLWLFPLANGFCAFFPNGWPFFIKWTFYQLLWLSSSKFSSVEDVGISRSAERQCWEKSLMKPPWVSIGALAFNSGNYSAGFWWLQLMVVATSSHHSSRAEGLEGRCSWDGMRWDVAYFSFAARPSSKLQTRPYVVNNMKEVFFAYSKA